jgi:hypothetical protein
MEKSKEIVICVSTVAKMAAMQNFKTVGQF